jgi:SAM-dependent methyltransferase
MKESVRYIHEETVHNFKAAREVVPFILDVLDSKSVVDVGCGIGTWLKVFEENGVEDILGIDGNYIDKSLLKIDNHNFIEYDLEKLYTTDRKFDLAISLEVAEHLSIESACVFVKTICGLSDTVLFSAAIPNQGGQNHINEQEPNYWIMKFKAEGYHLLDVVRPFFWDNENVDSWYRQNTLLFTKNMVLKVKLNSLESFGGKHLIHPILSEDKIGILNYYKNQIGKIEAGNKDVRYYFKLLLKALKRKIS